MSFEDFINAFEMPQLSGAISDMVADFRAYLDENELLPNWRNQLDVANCGALPEDILEGKAYMCPATGGAYSHKRCQYFGMYRNKRVEIVAEIQAVIDVFSDSETEIKWVNTTHLQDLETRAIKTVQQYRSDTFPIRVFLLGELYPLDFIKDTKGAMQSSKQYFDVSSLKITDAKALARALDKKNWSDLGFVRN